MTYLQCDNCPEQNLQGRVFQRTGTDGVHLMMTNGENKIREEKISLTK